MSDNSVAKKPPVWRNPAFGINTLLLIALAVVPPLLFITGQPFWLDVFTRLVILALAATALNLILGFGGLVSFGHAAYLGLGAYAVGIPAYHALYGGMDAIASFNGFVHLGLAITVSALFALITGAISLRTRGVNFIMITMAFGQMIFYAIVALENYGGALQGARSNEERMRALGVNCYRYQLVAFVISGVMCGYAGFLFGNYNTFISPEMMDWTRSGELMFMVIFLKADWPVQLTGCDPEVSRSEGHRATADFTGNGSMQTLRRCVCNWASPHTSLHAQASLDHSRLLPCLQT